MMSRKTVYVAGPISQGNLRANLARAMQAARELMTAGFAPLVPHWSCFLETLAAEHAILIPSSGSGFAHDVWMEVDLPWVKRADAVLRLEGDSKGADAECEHARKYAIPVFTTVADMVVWRDRADQQELDPCADWTYTEPCGCTITFIGRSRGFTSRMECCWLHDSRYSSEWRDAFHRRAKQSLLEAIRKEENP